MSWAASRMSRALTLLHLQPTKSNYQMSHHLALITPPSKNPRRSYYPHPARQLTRHQQTRLQLPWGSAVSGLFLKLATRQLWVLRLPQLRYVRIVVVSGRQASNGECRWPANQPQHKPSTVICEAQLGPKCSNANLTSPTLSFHP